MSDIRQLWFEDHLLSDAIGRAARRRCESLGVAEHEEILACGDRLARSSVAAAQEFYRRAAAARECFGSEFAEWVDLGTRFAESDPPIREAATAYFTIEPAQAARLGLEGLREWCDLAARVAQTSRKLAALFCEMTAPRVGENDLATLETWVEEGLRLHRSHGWHGEFLAQAYFSAPQALEILTPAQFALWAGLGAALRRVTKESDFYGSLPLRLRDWTDEERTVFLQTALGLAVNAPKSAETFYRKGTDAFRTVAAPLRTTLLRVCLRAARHASSAFAEVAPVLGAVVQSIPASSRRPALDLALRVAERFPVAVPALLRSLPKTFDETQADGVQAWVERGLALAEDNTAAAMAFFALESRTSLKVLHASSTGVALEEVQGLVRKFIQMLSGQAAVVRSVSFFQFRPPLEEFPGEDEVALPLRIDCLSTCEDNERLYRLLGAQLAGRREFGTYGVRPGPANPDALPGSDLVAYLRAEDRPELLEEIFLLCEGYRVARRLIAAYPGLETEFHWAATQLLTLWCKTIQPGDAAVLDC